MDGTISTLKWKLSFRVLTEPVSKYKLKRRYTNSTFYCIKIAGSSASRHYLFYFGVSPTRKKQDDRCFVQLPLEENCSRIQAENETQINASEANDRLTTHCPVRVVVSCAITQALSLSCVRLILERHLK